MKKLICAAVVAGSMFAMAEEPAKSVEAPVATAEAAKPNLVKPAMTEEQRTKMIERRQKMVAERRAAMEAKLLEVTKKYGLDDEKGKALIKDMMEAMRPTRLGMPNRQMPVAPKKPAEAK